MTETDQIFFYRLIIVLPWILEEILIKYTIKR